MKNFKISLCEWRAEIDVLSGANCISLKNERYRASILREPPEGGELDNPYLYGMPILFPVNRIEGGKFEFEGKTSRHYRGQGKMSLTDVSRGVWMVYENDEKYGFRLIYNGGEEGYICLEPQTCLANCQNSPFPRSESGFDYIAPRASKTHNSRIYLEEI